MFPELYAWLIPFAILGLSGGFAVFPGLVATVVRLVPCGRMMRVLVFALAWVASEWARSWVLTGFPWNLAGTVWAFSDAAVQSAALFGTFGLGLVTVFVAALPSVLGDETLGFRRAIGLVGGGFAAIAILWAGGAVRLGDASGVMVPDVRLRLIQPNIPQHLKWRPELRDPNLVKQVLLSREPDPEGRRPTHVIWPETSATFFVTEDQERRALLAKAAPADGLVIVGAPRRSPRGQPYQVWNSLLALNPQGRVVGSYDKTHLVPFGEYIPLRSVFASIPKITEGRQDFSPGSGVTTLRLPGLPPVSPLICYEVIFPGAVVDENDRPDWILNLTNDAWYGRSSGPYQHLMATKDAGRRGGVAAGPGRDDRGVGGFRCGRPAGGRDRPRRGRLRRQRFAGRGGTDALFSVRQLDRRGTCRSPVRGLDDLRLRFRTRKMEKGIFIGRVSNQ